MLSLLSIILAVNAQTCVDTGVDDCYIGQAQCSECYYQTNCAGKCVSTYGFNCSDLQTAAASCGGGSTGGGSTGGGSAGTCVDTGVDDCYIGEAQCNECYYQTNCAGKCVSTYGWDCQELQDSKETNCGSGGGDIGTCVDNYPGEECWVGASQCDECWVAQNCAAKCVAYYDKDCDVLQEFAATCQDGDMIGGGSGGGGVQIGSCTRYTAGPEFHGYSLEFVESRDGSITQDGNMITVVTPRPTPEWCVDTSVVPPQAGEVMEWNEYYRRVGLHKLACVGWTEAAHNASTDKNMGCQTGENAAAADVYSYEAFAQAVGYFPAFAAFDTLDLSIMDLAAFVAHSAKETTGAGPNDVMADHAWCWLNEMNGHNGALVGMGYGDQGSAAECTEEKGYPAWGTQVPDSEKPAEFAGSVGNYWNTMFYGRGSIQLSYCYNYHFFSNWVETQLKIPKTPQTDFFNNPGFVATKDWGFAAGLWFYMSPSSDGNKPSMHSIVDSWSNGKLYYDTVSFRPSDIGFQVNILNGGVECDPSTASGTGLSYAQKRLENLNNYLIRLNCPGSVNGSYLHMPQLATNGCTGKPALSGATAFISWNVDNNWECSGDSINSCEDDPICPWGGKQEPTLEPEVTTTTTSTPFCPPFMAGNCPTNPPAESTEGSVTTTTTTTKAATTTKTTTTTTTKASTTSTTTTKANTTTTKPIVSGARCCVRSSFIESADICHGIVSSTSCSNNSACAWSDACVDNVHTGESTTTTAGPDMKCCARSSAFNASCAGSSESACGSDCVWANASECIDHVHY